MAEVGKDQIRRKGRLGKGLGALIGDYEPTAALGSHVSRVALTAIVPNPFQPRQEFSREELESLMGSIEENGLLQPLLVRPSPSAPNRYDLVAGERRLRAVTKLGWTDVSVVVREVDDEELLVLALVENLQREELNPLEEAEGYQKLIERFGLTQDDVATSVGKNRSTVANSLRLLKLPPSVRKLVQNGDLSAGHARAIAGLSDPVLAGDLARTAAREGWSVRELERQVRGQGRTAGKTGSKGPGKVAVDPVLKALEDELRDVLGTKATIKRTRKGVGSIEVPFRSTEDFERVFALIAGREASDIVS